MQAVGAPDLLNLLTAPRRWLGKAPMAQGQAVPAPEPHGYKELRLRDEQRQVRWSRSTTMGRNLSTSSPVSHSWETGTGGSAQCPSCPIHAVKSQGSRPRKRGCHRAGRSGASRI